MPKRPFTIRPPRPGEPRNRDELSDALKNKGRVEQQLKRWSQERGDPTSKASRYAAEKCADEGADRARDKATNKRNQ